LGFNPEQILSSPLARAKETAEIVRRTLGTKSDVAVEESLLADAAASDVYRALRTWKGAEGIALITHLPLIHRFVGELLGAESTVGLYNGAIACIRCKTTPGHGKGTLLWLLPPRQWLEGGQWM
jgi:phosphohistidine phosphatase SixA